MSGKAPPKGPRALLGTPGGSSAPASSSSSLLSSSLAPTHNMNNLPPQRGQPRATPPTSSLPNNPSNRIGAPPPTGPRSLGFQNSHGRMPPPGPKHSFVNGVHHPSSSSGGLQKNRNPISIKGKNRDSGTTVNGSSSSVASTSRPESPTRPGELKQDRPAFHISLNSTIRDSSVVEQSSRGFGTSNGLGSTNLSSASPPRQGELKQDRPAFHMSLNSNTRKSSSGEPSTSFSSGELKPDRPALQIPLHPQPPPPTYDPPPPPPPSVSPPPRPPISSPPPPPILSPPPPPPIPSPPPPPPPAFPPPPPPASSPPPSPPPLPPVASPPPLPPSISESPPQPTLLPPPPPPPPTHQLIPAPQPSPRPPSPRPPPPLPRPNSLPRRPPSPSSWHSRPRSRESSRAARPHPPSPKKSQPPPLPPQPTPPPPPQQQLPPPPEWPPPRSEYPSIRSFKLLYDSSIDTASSYKTTRPSYYRALIDHIKKHAKSASVVQERIKVKEKEKGTETTLFRYEGEVVGPFESGNDDTEGMKEDELVVKDPRLEPGFRRAKGGRVNNELLEVKYEYDENSVGPPPPTSILVTNVSPLTPLHALRRTFATYGTIASFEPQIDSSNGAALGIIFIKYLAHDQAKRAVEKENGRKGGIVGTTVLKGSEDEEWNVVFDGEGGKLKLVLKELEERKKRERRRAAAPVSSTTNSGPASTPSSNRDRVSTPHSGMDSPLSQQRKPGPPGASNSNSTTSAPTTAPQSQRPLPPPAVHGLPPKPGTISTPAVPSDNPTGPSSEPEPQSQGKVLSTLAEARAKAARDRSAREKAPTATSMGKSSSTARKPYTSRYAAYYPLYRPNSPLEDNDKDKDATTTIIGKEKSTEEREKERQELLRELSTNGYEHVQILGGVLLIQSVRDEDVRAFFEGFDVDKILRDRTHLYITFPKPGVAHRATALLNSKSLHFQSVTLSVQPPPEYTPTVVKTSWTPTELVDEAQRIIVHELRVFLERDIGERLVQQDLKRLITEERNKRVSVVGLGGDRPLEKKGLKGLSFKKKAKQEKAQVAQEKEEKEEEEEEEEETERPPKKKRKTELVVPVALKKSKRGVDDEDIESEDEDEEDNTARVFIEADSVGRKRAVSTDGRDEEVENEEPVKKKQKIQEVKVKDKPKKPTATKKSKKALKAETIVEEVVFESDTFQSPFVDQLRLGSSSLTPSSRSPTPVTVIRPSTKRKKRVVTPRPPTPPPDPVGCGLCEDDEDIYFAKLALAGEVPEEEKPQAPPKSTDIPTFRKHLTASARTEGYYKITHAEKAAYVAQYQARAAASTGGTAPTIVDEPKPQHVTSSRSNRANARRRAQGLEEINQVQRAVALSKGETAANELTFKFNQLQTRKKHLRFARSPIHDWGLYAMEKIARGEMVIEYVGEVIRAQVADKREKAYERQGIGSSYLFRIDEDLVVDATKKGNLGRLINHSCDPNCTAKIITISGEKKIVIYAKQEIELGDEITYDYHFPFEQDKIPCLCGSAKCRGFLN